jgi:hypothetical protein
LKLYKAILVNSQLLNAVLDVNFQDPAKMYSNSFDIYDQWDNLTHDVFTDKLVRLKIVKCVDNLP